LIEVLNDSDPLANLARSYRAFGYVAIEKYDLALNDMKRAGKLSRESQYNKYLSKGILRMDSEDFLMASKQFAKAQKLFPACKDTYCLQVISIVKSYTYSLQGYQID
jgi:tetratricopeptide (TPR) repeat protein